MLKVTKLYEEIRAGSSLPLIVGGSDGNKYVVKPRGSGEGVLANVAEYLSLKLGQLAQIPVLEPELLAIEPGFEHKALDPEIRELLARSAGINFGTKYVEAAAVYHEHSANHKIDYALKNHIFLYDLFLLNMDRNSENPNIIFNQKGWWCLDYASALAIRSAIDGKSYEQLAILREMKRHLFYRHDIDPYYFIGKFKEIADASISEMIGELPAEWVARLNAAKESEEMKRIISKRLIDKKNNVHALIKRLDLLRVLKMETEEERRLKAVKNRNAFEQKFGKHGK